MQKEKLSALMDGEHNTQSLNQLLNDKDWQQSWQTYHLIRDVMQEETLLPKNFSERLEDLIAEEILEEQPQAQKIKPTFWQRMKPMTIPFLQVGIAASVCLVAVLGVRELNQSPENVPIEVLETLPFNHNVQDVSFSATQEVSISEEQIRQKNKRMAEMIQDFELQRRTLSPHSK